MSLLQLQLVFDSSFWDVKLFSDQNQGNKIEEYKKIEVSSSSKC